MFPWEFSLAKSNQRYVHTSTQVFDRRLQSPGYTLIAHLPETWWWWGVVSAKSLKD